jgi:hypothetical protein
MCSEPVEEREPLHERVLADLHSALDAAHTLGLLTLDIDELERFACESIRATERTRALAASAVAEADHARLATRNGVASLTAYLAEKTKGSAAAIAPGRTIGLWLHAFPEFAEAWCNGTLSEAHIRELKHLDGPRTRTSLIRGQHVHLEAARTLCFTDWLQTLSYWLLHADPDGSLTPERDAAYGLRTRVERNGDVNFRGRLDPITGEAFMTMIEHEAEKLFRHDTNNETEKLPRRQLESIALMCLLKRGFKRTDGSYPIPLINLVMSERVAEDLIARMAHDIDPEADRSIDFDRFNLPLNCHDIDARCETIRGTPLDPRRAWPAMLIGRLRKQVINAKGRTTDLGHDIRLFTHAQKNALLVESRGSCRTPGCDAPYAWLTADHITPHSHHGSTSLANGQNLCHPDNLRKTDRC